jgi:hypothetical protein
MLQVWVLGCPDQAAVEQAANPTQAGDACQKISPAQRCGLDELAQQQLAGPLFLASDLAASGGPEEVLVVPIMHQQLSHFSPATDWPTVIPLLFSLHSISHLVLCTGHFCASSMHSSSYGEMLLRDLNAMYFVVCKFDIQAIFHSKPNNVVFLST